MKQKLDLLVQDFRMDAGSALGKAAAAASVRIDVSGLTVADTEVAALFVAPGLVDLSSSRMQTLLFGYFRSKEGKFKAGYYSLRIRMGSDRPLEDVEWIDETGTVNRRTRIRWVNQPSSGNPNKVIICSSETRPFPNGSSCQYIDGTFDMGGTEYHFYCYIF
jgi:hypothetical protein